MLNTTQPDLTELVREQAAALAAGIFDFYSGDTLNHVNTCTAIATYLPVHHRLASLLAPALSRTPASQGADPVYDLLLRFQAAAQIGVRRLVSPSRILRITLGQVASACGVDLKANSASFDSEKLLRLWQTEPRMFQSDLVQCYLHASYVAKLIEFCQAKVDQDVKKTLALGVTRHLPGLAARLANPESLSYAVARLLWGAQILDKLDDQASADVFVRIAIQGIESLTAALDSSPTKSDKEDTRASIDFGDLCFMGINTHLLHESYPQACGQIRSTVQEHLLATIRKVDLATADLRWVALRLAGLRCVIDDSTAELVALELERAAELDTFRQIRRILRTSVATWSRWESALAEIGFNTGEVSVQTLEALSQSIVPQPLAWVVKSPWDTARERRGDCKAVTTLLAGIALRSGIPARLCLSFGQFSRHVGSNHMWIEVLDVATGDYTPLDHQCSVTGSLHTRISAAATTYPLSQLVAGQEHAVNHDILKASDRSRAILLGLESQA